MYISELDPDHNITLSWLQYYIVLITILHWLIQEIIKGFLCLASADVWLKCSKHFYRVANPNNNLYLFSRIMFTSGIRSTKAEWSLLSDHHSKPPGLYQGQTNKFYLFATFFNFFQQRRAHLLWLMKLIVFPDTSRISHQIWILFILQRIFRVFLSYPGEIQLASFLSWIPIGDMKRISESYTKTIKDRRNEVKVKKNKTQERIQERKTKGGREGGREEMHFLKG